MKPAAIAATLLLHTAPLVAVYQIQSTTPATHQGQTTLSVEILQGSDARQTQLAAHPATAAPGLLAATRRWPSRHVAERPRANDHPQTHAKAAAIRGRKKVSIPADYAASNHKPHYPLLAIKHEEQGTVILRILVQPDGTPGDIKLQRSSGYPLLDTSAMAAVRQWRFQPATLNQQPIAEWYQLSIPFQLR